MYIAKTDSWYLERVIYLIAGLFSLLGVVLAYFHSPYWMILNALVGVNLIIFSMSGFCIMANILVRFGIKSSLQS